MQDHPIWRVGAASWSAVGAVEAAVATQGRRSMTLAIRRRSADGHIACQPWGDSRLVFLAHFSMSGQSQHGRPETVHRGSGSRPRCRHILTVGRFTPRRSAMSSEPTGSHMHSVLPVIPGLTSVDRRITVKSCRTRTAARVTASRARTSAASVGTTATTTRLSVRVDGRPRRSSRLRARPDRLGSGTPTAEIYPRGLDRVPLAPAMQASGMGGRC